MLKIRDLHARYGPVSALNGIDLDVHEGEVVALLGANGAGKSTCLMSISGVVTAVTGSVTLQGQEILGTRASKVTALGVAHVPEGRHIFKQLTIEENLRMGAYRRRVAVKERIEKVYETFPILGERRRQSANSLSGGQQQMLAIGRALMSEPKVLMLDEPSLGLAPGLIADIYEIIRGLHRTGITLVLVEQNVELALSVASRGYVFERGNIVLSGTADELRGSELLHASYLGNSEPSAPEGVVGNA